MFSAGERRKEAEPLETEKAGKLWWNEAGPSA